MSSPSAQSSRDDTDHTAAVAQPPSADGLGKVDRFYKWNAAIYDMWAILWFTPSTSPARACSIGCG
jgi:hypothetical protein